MLSGIDGNVNLEEIMELMGKKVLVFGTGISGIGASKLLMNIGAEVIIYDGKDTIDIADILKQVGSDTVEVICGDLDREVLPELDLVVLSPGVPLDIPLVLDMKSQGIPIWGEIELAYQLGKGDVLAITGTNGKTTTTALLGEIMAAHNLDTYVVGNIGNPYTEAALETKIGSIIVAEMSSFQLETIHEFTPKVSAILNITPDHLNRHHTMEAYIQAKKNIAKNQKSTDVCVLNYEDEVTREFAKEIKAQVLFFSSKRKLEKGIYLQDDCIVYTSGEEAYTLCSVDELRLLGVHNYENVMAASAMALAYGVSLDVVAKVIREFAGVEHRIEFVCEKSGVMFYNDSKGTNPDAAIKAIKAMNRPTILIGGGYDKDSDYEEWIQAFDGKVKKFILTGQTREKINKAALNCGFTDTLMIESFDEAVMKCVELAKDGDAVLLSPACASWGVFANYEQRGDKFKELINNL